MKSQGCEGCNHHAKACLIKFRNELVLKCPCKICLIKMVCKKMCVERRELYESSTMFLVDEHNRIVSNVKSRG